MEEKLTVIDGKLDNLTQMVDGMCALVKGLSVVETQKYSDDLRECFEKAEERLRVAVNLVHKVSASGEPKNATYDVIEAAQRLRLAPFTVRQKCNRGLIRATKVKGAGGKGEWRIFEAELQRYEREGELEPPEPPKGEDDN